MTIKKRLIWIFFSVLALAQFAPMLDRVLIPALDHAILAAQPVTIAHYRFDVEARGIVLAECAGGHRSQLEVTPGETIETAHGEFREVRIRGGICTQFGYKSRETRVYLPTELLRPDTGQMLAAWETRTYVGVPSTKDADRLLTLQIRRLPGFEVELLWLSDGMSPAEYRPARLKLAQPEEMAAVEQWNSGLLPWKSLRLEIEHPFLSEPMLLAGRLIKVDTEARR